MTITSDDMSRGGPVWAGRYCVRMRRRERVRRVLVMIETAVMAVSAVAAWRGMI